MVTRFFSRRRVAADKSLFRRQASGSRKRRLQLEPLEQRAMLDGAGLAAPPQPSVFTLIGADLPQPSATSTLTEGLIASYSFEGGFTDASGLGNELFASGTYGFVEEGRGGGQALRTLGDRAPAYSTGGFMRAGFLENTELSAVTFNFWTRNEQSGSVYGDENALEAYVQVGYGQSGSDFALVVTPLAATGEAAVLLNTDPPAVLPGSTVTWSDWKMWTVSLESDGSSTQWSTYLNGESVGSGSIAADLFPSVNVVFGAHTWDGGASGSARMDVDWDDMRIFDRELSASEIEWLYGYDTNATPSDLLLS